MKTALKTLLAANILSFILSLVYAFVPGQTLYWNVFGIFLILTLTGNILASLPEGHKRRLDIVYLSLSSLGLFAVMLLNTLASSIPTHTTSISIVSGLFILALTLTGALLARSALPPYTRRFSMRGGTYFQTKKSKISRLFRRTISVLLAAGLLIGLIMAFFMLVPVSIGVAEVILSQYSLFYLLIFSSTAVLFIKISGFKSGSVLRNGVLILGAALYVAFAVPTVLIPSMLAGAEQSYTAAFGDIGSDFDDLTAFRQQPLSLPDYFFGVRTEEYELDEDVLYYAGTEGVDEGLELRYDVYTPLEEAEDLPGERAVLIRIHGGGWNTGGRGFQNVAQFNKYFASQGYIVFDVEYGLNNKNRLSDLSPVAEEVSGEFSIDDMVRHLGIFLTHLADSQDVYGADIDSVFLSGGSAGGHLANAVALGLTSGAYTDVLDERINISGIIPLYPANGLAGFQEITGEEELVDPALLVDENSPPALVYHGDTDRIVSLDVSRKFEQTYLNNGNTDFALIQAPYGEHVSDLYFPGYYSQMLVYYMERFMYEHR
ncbi:putative esterase/lipase [Alkalibacterium sp. AK22]|nr:putative esterase/lipase [Alkalibacterium sp. AK22]